MSAACASRHETWINHEIEARYTDLFHLDHAHSIEVWDSDELVGGVYGIALGAAFFGESMFSKVSNASKVAFIHMVQSNLYQLIDCQVYNDHLKTLGAKEIMRDKFLTLLKKMR